jgi:hypothetical protein
MHHPQSKPRSHYLSPLASEIQRCLAETFPVQPSLPILCGGIGFSAGHLPHRFSSRYYGEDSQIDEATA